MGLVETAKQLAPLFAKAAPGDDALRRLSDATWQQLLEGGFLRALQPARFGGGEVSLIEFLDAVMVIAAASPSAGWVTGVIGVHPWQLALFDERAQQDFWSANPRALHSSSYNPTGRAEPVAGGYKVSGRWSFSSGCDHCQGVNLGAVAGAKEVNGKPLPDFRSFLLLRDQYRIEDNWHVAGLKGTGSKDIVVDDAFVPEHRTQSHLDYSFGLPLPGQVANDGALYRLPWSVVFNTVLAASVLGSARGFVDLWIEHTATRSSPITGKASDEPILQRRLAEATWNLDTAVTRLRADARELWQMAEARETPSMALRGQLRWNMNRGCELVGDSLTELFHSASGRTIFLDHPLQRRFQDLHGALGHVYLASDPMARAVGGTLLGTSKPEVVM
jgi:3-hydroxy-9,10-secoandrosta-1,3,5(10)-triene-9,17-dione monooxygenase